MFEPDSQHKSDLGELSAINRLSIVTFSRIGLLSLLVCKRCNHSRESIYFSEHDFLILLALLRFQKNPSFMTKSGFNHTEVHCAYISEPCQVTKHVERWHVKRCRTYAHSTESGYNQLHTVSASHKVTTSVSGNFLNNLCEWKLSGSEGACLLMRCLTLMLSLIDYSDSE